MRKLLSLGRVVLLVVAWLALGLTIGRAKVLVIAPHPDDDVITAAGITYRAVNRGEPVKIVYVTNGDLFFGTQQGFLRQSEAVTAQVDFLKMIEDDLIFLGYPDGYLVEIFQDFTEIDDQLTTPYGQSTTYGNRVLGQSRGRWKCWRHHRRIGQLHR